MIGYFSDVEVCYIRNGIKKSGGAHPNFFLIPLRM